MTFLSHRRASLAAIVAITVLPFSCSSTDDGAGETDAGADAAVEASPSTPRDASTALPPLPPLEQRGLPCEVALLFQERCHECHDGSLDLPRLGTRAELSAPYGPAGGKRLAEVALGRMRQDRGSMPPPPRPRVPANEAAALEAWIAAGLPETACTPTPRDAGRD